jgi:hypothetical protein
MKHPKFEARTGRRSIKRRSYRRAPVFLRVIAATVSVFTGTATLSQPTLNPLAVRTINSSINLANMGYKCGWDNSGSRISLERSVLWSSALLQGAISEGKLTLAEATEAQAQLLNRVYLNLFETQSKHSESECKAWHAQWSEMTADVGSLKPLYLELPTEDARSKYLEANASNCLLAAISALDDKRSDAATIAHAAVPYCRESIQADFFAGSDSQAKIVNNLTSKVLEFRANKSRALQ